MNERLDKRLLALLVYYVLLVAYSVGIHINILNVKLGVLMVDVGFSPGSFYAIRWLIHFALGLLYFLLAWLVVDSVFRNESPKNRTLLLLTVALPFILMILGLTLMSPRPMLDWLIFFSIMTVIPLIASIANAIRTFYPPYSEKR